MTKFGGAFQNEVINHFPDDIVWQFELVSQGPEASKVLVFAAMLSKQSQLKRENLIIAFNLDEWRPQQPDRPQPCR